MSLVVSAFLAAALGEIRVERAGEVLQPDDQDRALLIFNELLDALNVDDRAIYTRAFTTFTLTPNLQPHTIGLAANLPTFAVTIARPMEILGANLVLTSVTPNIRVPIRLRDDDWWRGLAAQGIKTSVPTDLNYSADWPNGSIRLWPIPNTAYGLELETNTLLAQVAVGDTLDLPPGYQQALRLTLAELCAPSFGQSVSPSTEKMAREARARIWAKNSETPTLRTRDAGMPGGSGGGFNFLTGQVG